MSSSQHRCVFVGNIPYDATEEQLIQICEEVGPVVSFRLVLDRETGKPKGYGFCEFRDEETALSARRNLQGYEINGRQLRVDFAENDKGVDRNREQGRGGPGLTATIDTQKHTSGVRPSGEASFDQPLGITVAAAAAAVMAGALGGSQVPVMTGQGQGANLGSNGQPHGGGGGLAGSTVGNDPLTNHLAGMSKHQLYEIVSQMKDLIQQNEQQARQILVANPQLTKALFQAQIMLGMVRPPNPQLLPNIQQPLLQNVSAQSQSQVLAPQQQAQTQMVQPSSIQTMPVQPHPIQPMQQGQMQQPQVQVVQTSQPQNVQMQHHMQGIPHSQTQNISIQSQVPVQQHSSQSLPIQLPGQPLQQSHTQTTSVQLPFQNTPQPPPHGIGMQVQTPMQLLQPPPLQQSNLPLLHMQQPLSQQPRPPAVQPQTMQSMGFQLPPAQQASLSQPTLQHGGMPQSSLGNQYQHMQTSLSNQLPPQQFFQVTRSGQDMGGGPSLAPSGMPSSAGGVGMGLGGHQVGRGSAPMAWNQPPSSGPVGGAIGERHSNAQMGISGHVGSNNSLSGGVGIAAPLPVGSGTLPMQQDVKGYGGTRGNQGGTGPPSEGPGMPGMIQSQGYGQAIQQPPQLHLHPQMQLPLEQQKVLLQQVMNLTQEQINSLPPEQRQQVIELQQAFRS